MARKAAFTKVTSRTTLDSFPLRALVELQLRPLDASDFDDRHRFTGDGDEVVIYAHDSHHTGWFVRFQLKDITGFRILEKAKPPAEATFGTARLRFEGGVLSCNGSRVEPELVQAICVAACGAYYDEGPDLDSWGGWRGTLSNVGYVCGCVTIPRDQLEDALDWCATQLGWL